MTTEKTINMTTEKNRMSKILTKSIGIIAGAAISYSLLTTPKLNMPFNSVRTISNSNSTIELKTNLLRKKINNNIELKKIGKMYNSQEGLMMNNVKTRDLSVNMVFIKQVNDTGHGSAYILNGVPDKGMNWIQLFASYKYGSLKYKYPHFGVQVWNKDNKFVQYQDSMKYIKSGDIISMSMKFSKNNNYIYVSVEDMDMKNQSFKMKLKSDNATQFISGKSAGNCGEYFTGLMTEKHIKKPEFIQSSHRIVYKLPKPLSSAFIFYGISNPSSDYCNSKTIMQYYSKAIENLKQKQKIAIYSKKSRNAKTEKIEQISSNKFITY